MQKYSSKPGKFIIIQAVQQTNVLLSILIRSMKESVDGRNTAY